MKQRIYDIAFNSSGSYAATKGGRTLPVYKKWHSMISRCYSPDLHKERPTYKGCTVISDWLDYQNFAKWYDENKPKDESYHLDKDILVQGNKVYSPDTCCFVPRQLNQILVDSGAARGKYPQGVYFDKKSSKYRSQIRINGKNKYLGLFDCPQEAHQTYKVAKQAYVKEKALEWREGITEDVFAALMGWELPGG